MQPVYNPPPPPAAEPDDFDEHNENYRCCCGLASATKGALIVALLRTLDSSLLLLACVLLYNSVNFMTIGAAILGLFVGLTAIYAIHRNMPIWLLPVILLTSVQVIFESAIFIWVMFMGPSLFKKLLGTDVNTRFGIKMALPAYTMSLVLSITFNCWFLTINLAAKQYLEDKAAYELRRRSALYYDSQRPPAQVIHYQSVAGVQPYQPIAQSDPYMDRQMPRQSPHRMANQQNNMTQQKQPIASQYM